MHALRLTLVLFATWLVGATALAVVTAPPGVGVGEVARAVLGLTWPAGLLAMALGAALLAVLHRVGRQGALAHALGAAPIPLIALAVLRLAHGAPLVDEVTRNATFLGLMLGAGVLSGLVLWSLRQAWGL